MYFFPINTYMYIKNTETFKSYVVCLGFLGFEMNLVVFKFKITSINDFEAKIWPLMYLFFNININVATSVLAKEKL